jgi:glycosyltransferase involved in cell wall biosynthesis
LVNYPIKIIKHPKNLGLSVARNTGIRESSGDIIAFFDSDIYIPKII